MKRALIALLILAGIPFASIACSDDAAEQKTLKPTGDQDENEPEPRSSNTSNSNSSAVTTPPAVSTFDAGPAQPGTQNCNTTTNALECAQCCVMKNNPLLGCGCNVGSQCQAACGQNMCAGGAPDLACGVCLLQARCQIDLGAFGFGGDNEGNGNGSGIQGQVQACLQQSACQSKGGGNLPGGFGFGQP